jgi:pyridine nucleotide-disulfide oxidoreductase family protein
MKRLLLVGAGHAQLAVLAAMARRRFAAAEGVLVTPYPRALYSGMVPGLVAGRFAEADCAIDIAALARAAGVHLRLGQAVALDAAARRVTLADGQVLDCDLLSLDTGAVQSREHLPGAREHALFVRPIEVFAALWARARQLGLERPLAVVVIGGGAAGVELALAVRRALATASVTLLADPPAVPTAYPPRAQRLAQAALRRAGVQTLPGRCTAIEAKHVCIGTMRVACDVPIVATGAEAPAWLAASGLALDDAGFVRIGATLQSASHPAVFAAGDMSARDDAPHPKSGVYAVRAGPVLAENLRAAAAGGALARYNPQRRSLNLLSLGDGRAIASWGGWSMQGQLMGWWKDRLDRGFIERYRPR